MSNSDEDADHLPLVFGKYKGKTPSEVAETDPSYIVWMFDNVKNYPTCSKVLRDDCERDAREAESDDPRNWESPFRDDETDFGRPH